MNNEKASPEDRDTVMNQVPDIDLKEILDAKFRAGEGVVVISPTMTDPELVRVMRAAVSHGVPFKVMQGEKVTNIIYDEWHQFMPPLPRNFP